MDNRTVKQRLRVQRDYVATLAKEYHQALKSFRRIQKSEDLRYFVDVVDRKNLKRDTYLSAKAVLLSCSEVLQKTLNTLEIYRKGCDNLMKEKK